MRSPDSILGPGFGSDDSFNRGEEDVVRALVRDRLFGSVHGAPRIGRFRVLSVLGEGGMARVYSAYDEQLDRKIAIKVLRRDVHETSRRRIWREAKAMAKLNHRNIAQVFEVGEHEGNLFIAMEFIQGKTLDEWQRAPERTLGERSCGPISRPARAWPRRMREASSIATSSPKT